MSARNGHNSSRERSSAEGTGYTQFYKKIVDVQIKRLVLEKSPAHAVMLLALHRVSAGFKKATLEVSEAALATTMGVSTGQAHKLLTDLEDAGAVTIKRRQVEGKRSRATSLLSFTDAYKVRLPPKTEYGRAFYRLPNLVNDKRQREIVKHGHASAYLLYFILATRMEVDAQATISRRELTRLSGLTPAAIKQAVRILSEIGAVKSDGSTNTGTTYRLYPWVPAHARVKPLAGAQNKDGNDSKGGMQNEEVSEEGGMQNEDNIKYLSLQSDVVLDSSALGNATGERLLAEAESESVEIRSMGGGAAFRPSSEQTGSKSSWDGNTKPDALEKNATEVVDQLEGEKKPDTQEKPKGAKAPMLRQKYIDELKTTNEQRASIQDGEWDNDYLSAMGTSRWSISDGLVDCFVGCFEGEINPPGLVRVAAAYFARMQAQSAADAERSGDADFDAELQAIAIVRSIGRVVGAYERGEVRSCPHFLVSALEKNVKAWKLVEYDSEEDVAGENRYGRAALYIKSEEDEIYEANLWRGEAAYEEEQDNPEDEGREPTDTRNPDDQVEREPVENGSKAGASETYVETSGRWCMTNFAAEAVARALGGKWSTRKIQNISAHAFDLLAAREEQVSRDYPEELAESVIRTFGRVVGAYERGEVTHLRGSMREAHERNIAGEWRENGKGKTTTFVSGGTLYATGPDYGTVHLYMQVEVSRLNELFYSEAEIA